MSMTQRSFLTNRDTVTKPLNTAEAADCRDALVKVSDAPHNLLSTESDGENTIEWGKKGEVLCAS